MRLSAKNVRQFSDEILYTRFQMAVFQRLSVGTEIALYNGIEKLSTQDYYIFTEVF